MGTPLASMLGMVCIAVVDREYVRATVAALSDPQPAAVIAPAGIKSLALV